jgi:hypothetical protein
MYVSYIADVSGDILPYLCYRLNYYPGVLAIIIFQVLAAKVSGV